MPQKCRFLFRRVVLYAVESSCESSKDPLPRNTTWTRLCEFQRNEDGFWDQISEKCIACKRNGIDLTCEKNEYFQKCTLVTDSSCQLYVVADIHAELIETSLNNPCQSQCIRRYFLDDTDRCMPYSTLDELLATVNVSNDAKSNTIFYRHVDCTRFSDSFSQPCDEAREDGQYVAHGSQFVMDCTLDCHDDW